MKPCNIWLAVLATKNHFDSRGFGLLANRLDRLAQLQAFGGWLVQTSRRRRSGGHCDKQININAKEQLNKCILLKLVRERSVVVCLCACLWLWLREHWNRSFLAANSSINRHMQNELPTSTQKKNSHARPRQAAPQAPLFAKTWSSACPT